MSLVNVIEKTEIPVRKEEPKKNEPKRIGLFCEQYFGIVEFSRITDLQKGKIVYGSANGIATCSFSACDAGGGMAGGRTGGYGGCGDEGRCD